MSKRRKHQNIHGRGGKDNFKPVNKRRNPRLRPIKKPEKPGILYRLFIRIRRFFA